MQTDDSMVLQTISRYINQNSSNINQNSIEKHSMTDIEIEQTKVSTCLTDDGNIVVKEQSPLMTAVTHHQNFLQNDQEDLVESQ